MADHTVSPPDPIVPSSRPSVKLTHYVPFDGPFYLRHYQRASCGKLVDPLTDHAPFPTCPLCQAEQAAIDSQVF